MLKLFCINFCFKMAEIWKTNQILWKEIQQQKHKIAQDS